MPKIYRQQENRGVVGLLKASFLFDSGYIVQFEDNIIKVKAPNSNEISIYKNAGKLFPDAMNAQGILHSHINKPQLLFKEERIQ